LLCLTIDIDWAHDAVIADTLELLETLGAKATWFVTHATATLDEIRAARGHELGLHPNFNPLLDGHSGRATDALDRLRSLAPEAQSVRSHSLARSSRLATLFVAAGLTHESNILLPPATGSNIAAWRDWSGLIEVPIRWEDDVRLLDPSYGEPANHLGTLKLLVVDFHPIHLFLNTTTLADYEAARVDAQRPSALLARRCPQGSGGSRDRLIELLRRARERAVPRVLLGDIKPSAQGLEGCG